jgi:hypothetical protein
LGAVVLGMAVVLGVFIQYQSQEPRPPEDLPRAIALPALYVTMGLLAIIRASQRRPPIAVAAGLLCVLGAILSVATFAFAVAGVLLVLTCRPRPADRPRTRSTADAIERHRSGRGDRRQQTMHVTEPSGIPSRARRQWRDHVLACEHRGPLRLSIRS